MKLGNRSLFWNHEGDAVCSSRWAPRFHTTPDSTLRQISRARRFHTSPGWRSSKIDLQSRLSLSSRTAARPGSPRPQKMSISWRLFFSITQHLFLHYTTRFRVVSFVSAAPQKRMEDTLARMPSAQLHSAWRQWVLAPRCRAPTGSDQSNEDCSNRGHSPLHSLNTLPSFWWWPRALGPWHYGCPRIHATNILNCFIHQMGDLLGSALN